MMSIPFSILSALPGEPQTPEERLLPHLDRLFALAQGLTMNAEQAVRLVEETYRRAYASDASEERLGDARAWLYRLMVEVHAERTERPDDVAATAATGAASDAAESRAWEDFRRRLTQQFLDRALPAAFASLPARHRLLLMLCEVEGYACADAASVVHLGVEVACTELDAARAALHRALAESATPVERNLLASHLPDAWERQALARMVSSEFAPAPPTLHPVPESGATEPQHDEPPPPDAETPGAPRAWVRVTRQLTATLLIIAIAGALGYGFNALMQPEVEADLVALAIEQAGDVDLAFRTDSAEQAEQFTRDRLAWRLTLPEIDRASLQGVGVHEVADGVEVPVFRYVDAGTEAPITVYAYTYALLDRFSDRIGLERDILRQIQDEDNFDLYDLGDHRVLLWRHRDDIYIAVMPPAVDDLRSRIFFPS